MIISHIIKSNDPLLISATSICIGTDIFFWTKDFLLNTKDQQIDVSDFSYSFIPITCEYSAIKRYLCKLFHKDLFHAKYT